MHVDQQQAAYKNFQYLLLFAKSFVQICQFLFFSLFFICKDTNLEKRASQTRLRPRRSVEGPMNHKSILRDRSVGSKFTILELSLLSCNNNYCFSMSLLIQSLDHRHKTAERSLGTKIPRNLVEIVQHFATCSPYITLDNRAAKKSTRQLNKRAYTTLSIYTRCQNCESFTAQSTYVQVFFCRSRVDLFHMKKYPSCTFARRRM